MSELEVSATDLLLEEDDDVKPQQQQQQKPQQQQNATQKKKLSKVSSYIVCEHRSLGFAPCVSTQVILKDTFETDKSDNNNTKSAEKSPPKGKSSKNDLQPTTIFSSSFYNSKFSDRPVAQDSFGGTRRQRSLSPEKEKLVKEPKKISEKDLKKALEMLEM